MRADVYLVEHALAESREQAQRFIRDGHVFKPNGDTVRKPSESIPETMSLICEARDDYVSRGAYKLRDALFKYLPNCEGKIAIDIGASTGGFTDLLLQCGAPKVYAVDSGSHQLHEKIRSDSRVVSMENVNARYLQKKDFKDLLNLCVMDVSFISATLIIPAIDRILETNSWVFILIKPQFEVGREGIGRNGVVKETELREMAVQKVVSFARENVQWACLDVLPSPILGPQGNQEFIAIFKTK